ncbi:MAG: hypothetical protein V7765_22015, partial [Oleispira sp.]
FKASELHNAAMIIVNEKNEIVAMQTRNAGCIAAGADLDFTEDYFYGKAEELVQIVEECPHD